MGRLREVAALTAHKRAAERTPEQECVALLRETFQRWHVWHDGGKWHAARRGNLVVHHESTVRHSVHAADALTFLAQLHAQDELETSALEQWGPGWRAP